MAENQMSLVDQNTDASEALTRIQEDLNTKRQLVQEVLPHEITQLRKSVEDLQEIENSSTSTDLLNKINGRCNDLNREINEMMEKRMLRKDAGDDKLSLFKQNVRRRVVSSLFSIRALLFPRCLVYARLPDAIEGTPHRPVDWRTNSMPFPSISIRNDDDDEPLFSSVPFSIVAQFPYAFHPPSSPSSSPSAGFSSLLRFTEFALNSNCELVLAAKPSHLFLLSPYSF